MEDFAPQMVWLVISFIALYLLMARVALPRVADVLETRHGRIADDLDQAAQLKSQAETVIAEYEAALAEVEALAELREVASELAQAAAERLIGADVTRADVDRAVATAMQNTGSGA
jgi:F-type H+-transporting ATPase subunit b